MYLQTFTNMSLFNVTKLNRQKTLIYTNLKARTTWRRGSGIFRTTE